MVVSPDVGGVARARELAKRINAPLSIVDKRREKPGEVAEMTVIGNVEGKYCLIVDDMVRHAGTLCKAAEVLMEHGAKEVHSYITHGVMCGPGGRAGHQFRDEITGADRFDPAHRSRQDRAQYPDRANAPLFAQAILNIWHGTSVSSLFDDTSLGPIYDGLYAAE